MNFYQDLFSKLTEEKVIETLKLEMLKDGGVWKGSCPSGKHESISGNSFHISENKFHCWNCGIGGNLVHLIELVKFGTITKKKQSENFLKARDIACDIAGVNRLFNSGLSAEEIKELEVSQEERQEVEEVLTEATRLANLQLLKSFEGDFCKEIDLSRKAIEKFKVGYIYNNIIIDLLKNNTLSSIIKSGICEPEGEHKPVLNDRYSFPFIKNGNTVYMSGRVAIGKETSGRAKYKKLPLHSEKTPWVSKYQQHDTFFNEDIISKAKEIVIAEGLTDCIAACMAGESAIASSSVNIKEDIFKRIIDLSRGINNIYICYDVENSEAGQKSARKVAELFVKKHKELYIITLPKKDGIDKVDLKDYFKDHDLDEFNELKKESKTLIHSLINAIPTDVDRFKLSKAMEPVIELLACCDSLTIDNYLNHMLKGRYKMTQTDVSTYKKHIQNVKKQQEENSKDSKKDPKVKDIEDLKELSQGMDYKNNSLYYTLFIKRLEEFTDEETGDIRHRIIDVPYMVNSKREYFEAKPENLIAKKLYYQGEMVRSIGVDTQWSTGSGIPYGVADFVSGEKRIVDPVEIYLDVKKYFDRYVVFPEKNISVHLVLFIMASYMLMIFDAIGYVHLHAEKRSGKTRALEIIEGMGFCSVMSSSISDAALFRVIESTRCLLITDEAEHLTKQKGATNPSEKIELLNAGYKKSGAAIRNETINDQHTPTKFSTYCVKIFAGVKEIDPILRDRTITHLLKRVDGAGIKHFIPSTLADEWTLVRDKLHYWAMTYVEDIYTIYKHELQLMHGDVLDRNGIVSREFELWAPYLSIALHIDKHSDKSPLGKTAVFEESLQVSKVAQFYKDALESESFSSRMLLMIKEFIDLNNSSDKTDYMKDYYCLKDMTDYLKVHEGFEYLTSISLGRNLYGKLFLSNSDDKKRLAKGNEQVRDTWVKITQEKLEEAIKRCGIKL